MNILTHTDFVIFNKVDKMQVLVVEVDVYAYHADNPKQLKRDKMKDDILGKYGIPILRLGTNESGEEGRLKQALKIGNQGVNLTPTHNGSATAFNLKQLEQGM